ncbi:TPA: CbbQ/NirQ/NorQ/GpvN family protein [Serratia fonticola]
MTTQEKATTVPAGNLLDAYYILDEPFYRPSGNEIKLYNHADKHRLPLILKGPTGCGKTRFIELMAWVLQRPIITVTCHEDMTASDLIGRYLLDTNGTTWHDGPLTLAARYGAICYLDEIVEARQDTTVIIHPLTDSRRMLPLEKTGEVVQAHPDFQLIVSFNPGYQSIAKAMKASTRQRFVAMDFDYPKPEIEADIVAHESGVALSIAQGLVTLAGNTRGLKGRGLDEGASTRMLIYAGLLICDGASIQDSCDMTITHALTDDPDIASALRNLVQAQFGV